MGAGARALCAAVSSARAPASRPPARCRLPRVSVCAHTRAPTGVHAPPPRTCRSRTCGRLPLAPARCAQSPPGARLPWPHSRRGTCSALQSPGPAQLPSAPHPGSTLLLGLWRAWSACPAHTCPPADTPAAAAVEEPLFPFIQALSASACHCLGLQSVPTFGSRSFLVVPHFGTAGYLETWNSFGETSTRKSLDREDECHQRHLSGLFGARGASPHSTPIRSVNWLRVRVRDPCHLL